MGDQYADLSVPTSQDVHREFSKELYVAYTPISGNQVSDCFTLSDRGILTRATHDGVTMRRQCPWVHKRIDAAFLNIGAIDTEERVHTAHQSKR